MPIPAGQSRLICTAFRLWCEAKHPPDWHADAADVVMFTMHCLGQSTSRAPHADVLVLLVGEGLCRPHPHAPWAGCALAA
jgi:hypothetical protein